jgi:hypothetical protein
MRLHTTAVELADLHAAAERAGVTLVRYNLHGSKTHAHSWDVILSGSGAQRSQYVATDVKAATWDEWGMFLAELFRREPAMRCGNAKNPIYADASHFSWVTDNRFDDLAPDQQHALHRWDQWGMAVTGSYSVKECRCGAVCRWVHTGTWV